MTEEHVISDLDSCVTLAACLSEDEQERVMLTDKLYATLLGVECGLVCAAQVVPKNAALYDQIAANEDPTCSLEDDACRVLAVSKEMDNHVEVMLVFPVKQGEDVTPKYQPHTIRFDLSTFLNIARAMAVHHQDRLVQREAQTEDNVPKLFVPDHLRH